MLQAFMLTFCICKGTLLEERKEEETSALDVVFGLIKGAPCNNTKLSFMIMYRVQVNFFFL